MPFKNSGASYEITTLPNKLSANAYAIAFVWTCAGFKTKVITFTATDNDLSVTTYQSNNGGLSWTQLDAEFDVTTAAAVEKAHSANIYGQIKAEVKSKTPGSHGTLSTRLFGTSLS